MGLDTLTKTPTHQAAEVDFRTGDVGASSIHSVKWSALRRKRLLVLKGRPIPASQTGPRSRAVTPRFASLRWRLTRTKRMQILAFLTPSKYVLLIKRNYYHLIGIQEGNLSQLTETGEVLRKETEGKYNQVERNKVPLVCAVSEN
ncbi:eukaryotic translation initiation factor 5A-2-like [Tenrec ecaudatus]|uniref:eukaryotic translation initiation factor 5A-2-like n=1 Tax=Tenrec ecaudatus TaxID=94439 RepID=UPI003F5AADF6